MRSALLETFLVFLFAFVIYVCSPVITSLDSRFVIPTAVSIERHGSANIDKFSSHFPEAPWAASHSRGHLYNVYPIGVPVMILPAVFAWDKIEALRGTDLEASMVLASPLSMELVLASLFTAGTVALLFYYCRERLSSSRAALLALLFAFGTSAYSSASRALWQHGPAMLLFMIAMLLYERLQAWKWRAAIALGSVAGFSFTVRPSNVIVVLGLAILVGYLSRSWLLFYICGVIAALTPVVLFDQAVYGTTLSPYYDLMFHASTGLFPTLGLAGTLFSPSRGLFIFSPFLLFAFLRLHSHFRKAYPFGGLEWVLVIFCLAYWVGTSRTPFWWGGGCIGPRLLCETLPCLAILMVPIVKSLSFDTLRRSVLTSSFAVLSMLSLAIHFRSSVDADVLLWNSQPANVDQSPTRLWSWRDPQFLRGFLK